jgi:hypothetical protein
MFTTWPMLTNASSAVELTALDFIDPLFGRSLAATGAHLARESEITPSSPKVRRELFQIVLQEQILLAAR